MALCFWDVLQKTALLDASSQAIISYINKDVFLLLLRPPLFKTVAGDSLGDAFCCLHLDGVSHKLALTEHSAASTQPGGIRQCKTSHSSLTHPPCPAGEGASSRGCQMHQPWSGLDRLCRAVVTCICTHMGIFPVPEWGGKGNWPLAGNAKPCLMLPVSQTHKKT